MQVWLTLINPYGTDTEILCVNLVNTMAADVLAPCVTRPSEAMVLTMQDKGLFVFHGEGFQSPAPSQCYEMTEVAINKCMFPKINLSWKEWTQLSVGDSLNMIYLCQTIYVREDNYSNV